MDFNDFLKLYIYIYRKKKKTKPTRNERRFALSERNLSVLSSIGIIYEIGLVVLFYFENKASRKAGKNAEKPRGRKNRIRLRQELVFN